jgi:hypothetical protein
VRLRRSDRDAAQTATPVAPRRAGREPPAALSEAVSMLETGPAGGGEPGPHADGMARVMRRWAEERGMEL